MLYLVCLRAMLVGLFLGASWSDDPFTSAFGDPIIGHGIWGRMAFVAAAVCAIGVAVRKGKIVMKASMVLFVLWLYLIVVYLSEKQIALALIEAITALLFAYFYISVYINRKWGVKSKDVYRENNQ